MPTTQAKVKSKKFSKKLNIETIIELLKTNPTITSVDLNDRSIEEITKLLKTNTTITSVDLSQRESRLNSRDIQSIVNSILDNPESSLEHINLSNNLIGFLGVGFLSILIRQKFKIISVELRENATITVPMERMINSLTEANQTKQSDNSIQLSEDESNLLKSQTEELQKNLEHEIKFIDILESIKSTGKKSTKKNRTKVVDLNSTRIDYIEMEFVIKRMMMKKKIPLILDVRNNGIIFSRDMLKPFNLLLIEKQGRFFSGGMMEIDLRGNIIVDTDCLDGMQSLVTHFDNHVTFYTNQETIGPRNYDVNKLQIAKRESHYRPKSPKLVRRQSAPILNENKPQIEKTKSDYSLSKPPRLERRQSTRIEAFGSLFYQAGDLMLLTKSPNKHTQPQNTVPECPLPPPPSLSNF